MRRFICMDCNHTWELPHGQGGRGIDMICPKCSSKNIRREDRGFGGRGNGQSGGSGNRQRNQPK